jgi:hypothetical protein
MTNWTEAVAQKTWMKGKIEVDVSGFFTTHHHFETEAGHWGKLKFPAFSDHGVLRSADGRQLVMRKVHWLGSSHELIEGEVVRGTADRRGLLCRGMVIHFKGQEYLLEPEGLLSQGWYLTDTVGNVLLHIQPRGILRQGAYLSITAPMDADLVTFAYYLVHMRAQEDAAAVAATSAAAAS